MRAFRLYSVPHESESANLLYNSSFEYAEDGVPTHFQYLGLFDWWNRPAEEYEGAYLKRVGVDTNEFHSGRQSLRLALGPFLTGSFYLQPSPLATAYSGAKTGCTYVVVSKKDSKPKQLSRYGYEKYKPAGAYVIYRRQP